MGWKKTFPGIAAVVSVVGVIRLCLLACKVPPKAPPGQVIDPDDWTLRVGRHLETYYFKARANGIPSILISQPPPSYTNDQYDLWLSALPVIVKSYRGKQTHNHYTIPANWGFCGE